MPDELIGSRVSSRHFSSLFVKGKFKLDEEEKLLLSTLDTLNELRQLRTQVVCFRTALLEEEPGKMK